MSRCSKALGRLMSSAGLVAEKFSDPVAFLDRLKHGRCRVSNPRRMDAPDEWFWKSLAFGAIRRRRRSFHHRARRSVSAPDRSRCGSFRLLTKPFEDETLSVGSSRKSESDVGPKSCSPFLGPARPRPEPPDKVTWLEAPRVSSYI